MHRLSVCRGQRSSSKAVLYGLEIAASSRRATHPQCFIWELACKSSDTIGKEFKLKYLKLMSFQVSMLLLQLFWVLKIVMQLYRLFGGKILGDTNVKNKAESFVCPCVAVTASVKHRSTYSAFSRYCKNHLLAGQTLQHWWIFSKTICVPQPAPLPSWASHSSPAMF